MKRIIGVILLACTMCLSSCKNREVKETLPLCRVMTVAAKAVEINESYSASIQGRQDIDIYPQISGTITELRVYEGKTVRKGEVMFVIDQVPYRAALEQAKALEEDARNSLSYTEVKSPSNGVVGTLPYREGALVSASMAIPLTSVSDNSEMYVYFSITEKRVHSLLRQYGSHDEVIRQMPPVRLQLNDGSLYDGQGHVESISGIINRKTGTVSVRSIFDNTNRTLLSGGIGNVIIPHREDSVIVIPQTATTELQNKILAYKVAEDGCVHSCELTVEKLNDGKDYIVRSGLAVGDVIVTEGTGLLRDGIQIDIRKDEPSK